jgi:hypothetical protein
VRAGWDRNPERRPSAEQIVGELERLIAAQASRTDSQGSAAGSSPPSQTEPLPYDPSPAWPCLCPPAISLSRSLVFSLRSGGVLDKAYWSTDSERSSRNNSDGTSRSDLIVLPASPSFLR